MAYNNDNKPDDRSNNVERIQEHIQDTKHNIELAEDMIVNSSDKKQKTALQEKNQRREKAIDTISITIT